MKTEGQIREKQIELQAQLINAIEAKHTFESAFERKPTEEEDKCCEECEYSSNAIYSLPCTECDENHSKFTTLPEEKEESSDPYPDTEADGFVFCGKCGKLKEV